MKALLIFCLLLTSCAGPMKIHGGPANSAYEVILDLRIKAYFEKCDYADIIYIEKVNKSRYVGEAYCGHYGVFK